MEWLGGRVGFDIYGKSPKKAIGRVYRRNVWVWNPMWHCLKNIFPEICLKVKNGHINVGDGLNEEDCIKLSNAISTGHAQMLAYLDNFRKSGQDVNNHLVSIEDFYDFAYFLKNCG